LVIAATSHDLLADTDAALEDSFICVDLNKSRRRVDSCSIVKWPLVASAVVALDYMFYVMCLNLESHVRRLVLIPGSFPGERSVGWLGGLELNHFL
jgi:hypothetical protein